MLLFLCVSPFESTPKWQIQNQQNSLKSAKKENYTCKNNYFYSKAQKKIVCLPFPDRPKNYENLGLRFYFYFFYFHL